VLLSVLKATLPALVFASPPKKSKKKKTTKNQKEKKTKETPNRKNPPTGLVSL